MPRRPPTVEGFVLKNLRESLGLTQAEAGLRLGLSADQVNSLERGGSLTPERLKEMALKLDEDFSASLAQGMAGSLEGLLPGGGEVPPLELTRRERVAVTAIGLSVGAVVAAVVRKHRLAERVRHDREAAERQWEEVRRCTAEQWQTLLEKDPGFATWALVERLCHESEGAAPAAPQRALFLARRAVEVAERVDGSPAWRACLLGYSWAFVGNTLRVGNDLHGADAAFDRAWELWQSGAAVRPTPLDESRIYDLTASFRRNQGEMSEALSLLNQALAMPRTEQAEGRILLKKALTLEKMGEPMQALRILDQAIPKIDLEKEPRQLSVLQFTQGTALCSVGRYSEAEKLIPNLRLCAITSEFHIDLIRVHWLEAKVLAGTGREVEAEARFKQVAEQFLAHTLLADAALATLELAHLYLLQNRTKEVRTLAFQAEAKLRKLGVDHKAEEAVSLFWKAAQQETATMELAKGTIEVLRRATPLGEQRVA